MKITNLAIIVFLTIVSFQAFAADNSQTTAETVIERIIDISGH